MQASSDPIDHWLNTEFTVSTLSRAQQQTELEWFQKAAKPFQGLEIRVVSERIDTHLYEASVLAKAFEDITGIKVIHEITGEDDVIKKLSAQMAIDYNLFDAYINDSDLIGTHYRSGKIVALNEFMSGEGQDVTLPTLDLDDFIGLAFTTGPDGNLYQLPDQQFANVYWYRHDWFNRADLQRQFLAIYGYELGVPKNWSAYEDIAEFFTVHVRELDGNRVYGHMDYGKTDPSMGWRFSDAWLSMAGAGDIGLPNGLPVDEWGIRVEDCRPVGASVSRGGALNSPAAVYAVRKYAEWLTQYAPPFAKDMNFTEAGRVPSQGQIAQQIFWYTAFTSDMIDRTLSVTDEKGIPKWRMAPSPQGAYWQEGMKLGYQDAGAWTLLKSTPLERRKAAWLYAQFVVSKTVSLKKFLVGLTPIRRSDIESDLLTEQAERFGGLIEFYRSDARNAWSPTGTNVPDYPYLSDLWWKNISKVPSQEWTAQQAMYNLALSMDARLAKLSESQDSPCAPALNPPVDEAEWFSKPGAPKPKLENEKPTPITMTYEEALEAWSLLEAAD